MSLEVVVGPMFSGKSSYALSYVRRQRAIGKLVLIIKPKIDNRYSLENVMVTHDNERLSCVVWDTRDMLCSFTDFNYDCYVIEEAQFFQGLKHFCEILLKHSKNILVVGLDGCAKQNKFGEILDIIPLCSSVKKLNALCFLCKDGTLAPYTKSNKIPECQIDVGGAEKYVAVCLRHLTNE